MTESFSKIFVTAKTRLLLLKKHLQADDYRSKCVENISLQEFLLKFDNTVREISLLTAQLEVTCRNPSLTNIKEIHDLISNIEVTSENLVFIFHSLSNEFGQHFRVDILRMNEGILTSLVHFLHSLNVRESKSRKYCLKYAENVFIKCEEVQKMPKNNVESVLRFLLREEMMLVDALQEIDEEVKSNFSGLKYGEEIDNSEMWSNQDKKLLPPCVVLIKTSRLCLKKVISAVKLKGNCSTTTNIQQLDEIAFTVKELTQTVENFVSTFSPPMNQKDVKQDALKVVNIIQNLLTQVQRSHFVQSDDESWLNVLFKSIDHNNNKLQPLFSDEIFNENSETDNSDEE